ncbi:hypothetical protein ACWGDE_16715 [Streptomyces sp. NPDC054956]
MTPHSLAFYVDVVTTGTVLGVGPADPPDRATEVFGADFGENLSPGGHSMVRDFGLAEFYWDRDSAGHPWSGHHFSLQVHRLAHRNRGTVDGVLRDRYGRFAPRLRFDKLRRLLERRGVPLLEVPEYAGNAPHYRTFWQPDSQVSVSIIGMCGEYSTPSNLRVGDVYAIRAPMTPEDVEWRRSRAAA